MGSVRRTPSTSFSPKLASQSEKVIKSRGERLAWQRKQEKNVAEVVQVVTKNSPKKRGKRRDGLRQGIEPFPKGKKTGEGRISARHQDKEVELNDCAVSREGEKEVKKQGRTSQLNPETRNKDPQTGDRKSHSLDKALDRGYEGGQKKQKRRN